MDISTNPGLLQIFFKEMGVTFRDAYNKKLENLILNKVAMKVDSISSSTVHGWVNQIPGMKEWKGPREISNIGDEALEITNRIFQSTISLPVQRFRDDQHGLFKNNAMFLGNAAASFWDQLLIEAALKGTSAKWIDSVAIFDGSSNRTFDGTNAINNYVTTAFDAQGVALNAAYAAMTSYLGHDGRPLGAQPLYLVHGPQLRSRAIQAVESPYSALVTTSTSGVVAGQITNPNFNLVTRVETPYLVNGFKDSAGTSYNAAYYWFLVGDVMGLKPWCVQMRHEPEIQEQRTNFATSDWVFANDEFQWGVRSAGEGFIAQPWLIYGGFATA